MTNNTNAPTEWVIQWIHNNYQEHPNIAGLCDALREAAPPAPRASPSHDAYVLQLLVAGGHVTAQQVEQAREIAARVCPAPEAVARRPLTDAQCEAGWQTEVQTWEGSGYCYIGEPAFAAGARFAEEHHGIGGPAQVEQPERKGVEWQDIASAPLSESLSPFLILLPEQRTEKGDFLAERCVVQVSRFEGELYPDVLGSCVDWEDRVVHATHWAPLLDMPAPPAGTNTTEG